MVEGYVLRKKETERAQAYFTSCIMCCMASSPVTPAQVYYGLHPEEKPDLMDEREKFLQAAGLPSMKKGDR